MMSRRNVIIAKTLNKLARPELTSNIGIEVLDLLQQALTNEFQQWDLYYAYKGQLTGLSRDPLMSHFETHAGEEAKHIEVLQRYIVGMGAIPTTERKRIPLIKDNSVEAIIELQLEFEVEAVEIYKKILKELNEDSAPLRIEIENILAVETEHMQDLQMFLRKY